MDINTFYGFTATACFTLVGLWWTVVKDRPAWFKDDAVRSTAGGVFASFLIPALMSLGAQVGGDNPFVWQAVFIFAALAGIVSSTRMISRTRAMNSNGMFSKNRWVVPLLYGAMLFFAVFPRLSDLVGLKPLQLEGLLLCGLILVAHLLAWEFISRSTQN